MKIINITFRILVLLISIYSIVEADNNTNVLNGSTRLLSRRKRFLVFPEGSSFQLVLVAILLQNGVTDFDETFCLFVFCVTYPMLAVIGDILLWGNTAALAFELPQDPYSPFDHRADPLHRRMDSKTIYYTNDIGKIVHKAPYKRKPIVNPAFAKRSVDSQSEKISSEEFKIDRKQMHDSKHKREFLKGERMDGKSVEFHRSSRTALYRRLEALLRGLGTNGKHCLLKTLCEVGQTQHQPQGTFLQEIMRALFTLPKSKRSEDDDEEYDSAHSATKPCHELYTECEGNLNGLNSPFTNNY